MPAGEIKGITARTDAERYAEIKAYPEAREMAMGEFIALAAEGELHPKIQEKKSKSMENMRTLGFQVPVGNFNPWISCRLRSAIHHKAKRRGEPFR